MKTVEIEITLCADCGTECKPSPGGLGTGYAIFRDGARVCYACADKRQLADIEASQIGDKFPAYVSSDGRKITSWTGGELMRVIHWGDKHPWTLRSSWGARYYLRAVDAKGRVWSGTGADGMYANLRLTKATTTA